MRIKKLVTESVDYGNGVNVTWSNTKETHRMNLVLLNGMSYPEVMNELRTAIVVLQAWQLKEEADAYAIRGTRIDNPSSAGGAGDGSKKAST
jgi:hypothetical protein